MTVSGVVGDWLVELVKKDAEGRTTTMRHYDFPTEQAASLAIGPLLLKYGYQSGSVRMRTADEAGAGGKRG